MDLEARRMSAAKNLQCQDLSAIEMIEASMQNRLNRSQTRALETLKEVSSEEFQRVKDLGGLSDGERSLHFNLKNALRGPFMIY